MFQILADQTTSILKDVNGIGDLLGLVVRILSYGLGAAAIIGVVVAGILYLTARDNESQVVAAKQRLLNTVIGLVAWVVMFSVVNWLIPGGVPDPKDPSNNLQVEDADNNNPIQGGGTFEAGIEEVDPPETSECQAHPKRSDCFRTYTSQEQMLSSANSFFEANEGDRTVVLTNLYKVYAEKGYSFADVPQEHIETMSCKTLDGLHSDAYANGDNDGMKAIEKAGTSKGCEWG